MAFGGTRWSAGRFAVADNLNKRRRRRRLRLHFGIRITSADKDRIFGEMDADERHLNAFGILHGGALMAFADDLGGSGARFHIPAGARTTTIERGCPQFLGTLMGGSPNLGILLAPAIAEILVVALQSGILRAPVRRRSQPRDHGICIN